MSRPGVRGERGMSLPELLIALLLFSFCVVALVSFEAATNRGMRRSLNRVSQLGAIENAGEGLRGDIRRSSAFPTSIGDLEAGPRVLILQTWTRNGPVLVVWRRDDEGKLLREEHSGSGEGEVRTRVLARGVSDTVFQADRATGLVRFLLSKGEETVDAMVLARLFDETAPEEPEEGEPGLKIPDAKKPPRKGGGP